MIRPNINRYSAESVDKRECLRENISMIFGRETEKAVLDRLFLSKNAEFLAVYGRRRIGKTFLIAEFFKNKGVYFEVTGIKDASKKDQLKRFYKEFSSKFPKEALAAPKDWSDAFDLMAAVAKNLDPQSKFILFLDELPWLASAKSEFLPNLDYAWNHTLSRFPNILLIVCGSAAAWILRKVIKNKGGLHGRLSAKIRLQPFTLSETEHFLTGQGIQMTRKQLVELYMAIGGVAKYIMNVTPGMSATQIINELCFTPQGFLFSEFSELYHSLFNEANQHIAIVRALAQKRKGITLGELLSTAQIQQGGRATEILEELEESGFIARIPAFGKKSKEHKFRLIDEYTFFYLSWIEQARARILRNTTMSENYWAKIHKTPAWYEWSGHAFETLCMKNIGKIKSALNIAGVMTEESHWQHAEAEIDLLIDRADDCIHLCEIKFCNSEFVIDRAYAERLEKKRDVFQRITGTKKAIFITMFTPYGVLKNENYLGLVDQQLTLDALF